MARHSASWRPFWFAFPVLALVLLAGLAGYAVWAASAELAELRRDERFAVNLQAEAVSRGLTEVADDICWLSHQNELSAFLADGLPETAARMAVEYQVLAANVGVYDQIRFINAGGWEAVRVDMKNTFAYRVPDRDLQDKSGRYYVGEILALQPGQIYVSPLDLNIEHGEIELPHKPMIRVGTPVADDSGRVRGLVLINYRAQAMLDAVKAAGAVSPGDAMMLNDAGYWLVTPNPPPGWGFMFPELAQDRMADLHPEAWAAMRAEGSGAVRTPDGLFTFRTLYPLVGLGDCAGAVESTAMPEQRAGYAWIMASHVPAETLDRMVREAALGALWVGLPVLLLLAVLTRTIGLMIAERQRHRAYLESLARVDGLTGLANRMTFDERMETEVTRGARSGRGFALLYLDLDGFKAINDSAGHAAGDIVLRDVAEALKGCCRAADLPARVGGDEFVVLLPEVPDADAARTVAEKVLARIEALTWPHGMTVGVSVGVALWPDHGRTATDLMRRADEAMYAAKKAGKAQVRLAGKEDEGAAG
ncbi:GGDEF domain-containing protein [Roseospirillum parvum]|uniref:Diguanylate cyclase (GGDEF) domain-containing protein n=1 Tax=Roseospirillum parvum TaxID=83401 RepID=A0A1G7ZP26_9PROT|nr:GGDEF domain-containing protein [Roseospirillum parvum]SDH10306.1 diguanylate cyclase (GGDEF) domain-containing protein [Roseospirillum parvum]